VGGQKLPLHLFFTKRIYLFFLVGEDGPGWLDGRWDTPTQPASLKEAVMSWSTRWFRAGLATVAGLAFSVALHAENVTVDKEISAYEKVSGVTGNLNSVGSDTLVNLMTLWAEAFRAKYPDLKIQIEGKGSGTAPPALISGTAQLGPMSRLMKSKEIDDFEKAFNYKPTCIRVAVDAVGIYVNKDNPLEKLTLKQIDAIFSKTRAGGHPEDIDTWGKAGLQGEWAQKPIRIYGRNSASGTYGYVKEHALFKGDYKDSVKEQPGSAAVVMAVSEDLQGIGYSGIGYKTSGVKALTLADKEDKYFTTDAADVYGGKYPLSRFLVIYVNKAPNKPLDPTVREFMKFVLSQEGQAIVVKDGYLPLTKAIWAEDLAKVK
jgi:phosphate transport system substrate-binding protein